MLRVYSSNSMMYHALTLQDRELLFMQKRKDAGHIPVFRSARSPNRSPAPKFETLWLGKGLGLDEQNRTAHLPHAASNTNY